MRKDQPEMNNKFENNFDKLQKSNEELKIFNEEKFGEVNNHFSTL